MCPVLLPLQLQLFLQSFSGVSVSLIIQCHALDEFPDMPYSLVSFDIAVMMKLLDGPSYKSGGSPVLVEILVSHLDKKQPVSHHEIHETFLLRLWLYEVFCLSKSLDILYPIQDLLQLRRFVISYSLKDSVLHYILQSWIGSYKVQRGTEDLPQSCKKDVRIVLLQ